MFGLSHITGKGGMTVERRCDHPTSWAIIVSGHSSSDGRSHGLPLVCLYT